MNMLMNYVNMEIFNEMYSIINRIEEVRDYAEKNNLLDTQEYLSFLDALNKLSID